MSVRPRPRDRQCSDCAAPITCQSKTGRCKPCATRVARANPEMEARRIAGFRAAVRTEESREKRRAARVRVEAERKDDPVWIAYKRKSGQRLRAAYDASPEGQAKNAAKRAETGRKISALHRAWCPPAYLALDDELRRKDLLLVDRKRIIAEQAAADASAAAKAEKDRVAALSPLERQLERLRNGALLVERHVMPTREHTMTLGGVASGLL